MPPQSMAYSELDASYPTGFTVVTFGDYQMWGLRDDLDVFCVFIRVGTSHFAESSWKVHISVNAAQLGEAWDLIYPILVKDQVDHFKVTRQRAMMNKSKWVVQSSDVKDSDRGMLLDDLKRMAKGMQITLYIPLNGELKIQNTLKSIEKALKAAKISPGEIDKSDRAVGDYCSVRNAGSEGNYVTHDKVSSYNPTGAKDPFKKKI